MDKTVKQKKVLHYLEKYPEQSTRNIARIIFENHPLLFNSYDTVRAYIRKLRGENKSSLLTIEKYGLPKYEKKVDHAIQLPKSYKKDRKPFILPKTHNNILLISDLHMPYHDNKAIMAALNEGKKSKINTIFINGDLLDFHQLSKFEKDPEKRDTVSEFECVITFLKGLRKMFPKVAIYFREGNHDERYRHYLLKHVPQLWNDNYYTLKERLGLESLKITHIDNYTVVKAGKLDIIHGDKIIRGVFAPVNAARGAFLRTKSNIIIGHTHSVSEHIEGTLKGEVIGCWSTGCLCDLHPDYDPHNTKHKHGFAIVTFNESGSFRVNNYKIINGIIH